MDEPGAEAQTPQIFIAPSNLPPPKLLVFDDNLATTWQSWKKSWIRYEIATDVHKHEGIVRVSTLLSVIGQDGVMAHNTFAWGEDENQNDVDVVLKKFDEYCSPRTQIIYERYRFNNRSQSPGENIFTYLTDLRTIARNCAHDSITPDEILRDRLVLGIRDDHVRERLLRLNDLALQKAVDIIKAAEQTQQQVKLMSTGEDVVNTPRATQQKDAVSESKQSRKTKQLRYAMRNRQQETGLSTECGNCGMTHDEWNCPAFGTRCFNCEKMNHFARKCRGRINKVSRVNHTMEVEQKPEEDPYCIRSISDCDEPKACKAVIKLQISKPKAENTVQFQIHTGSQCGILPASLYKQVTGDDGLQHLKTCKKEIVSYTGEHRKGQQRSLNFNIINRDYQPVLSLDTSIELGVVNLSNCDILALTVRNPEDNSYVAEEYADVFDGLGEIPGAHSITMEDTAKPVVHAPRRVPVALRSQIKAKLDELVKRGVIVSVTEPTRWVSSMLAVVKPNKIRICIDPRDLNRVIRHEHYQLPTVDEVASRLMGAKKFTLCDAKDGFHQIKLDTASSYLTTFDSPFGRYRWKCMPFGISSAPEVWQRRMHEFAQDLNGVEVIADDFLIARFGETEEEVNRSLERNEHALRNVVLGISS